MKRLILLILVLTGLTSYAQTRHAYLPEGLTTFQTSYQKMIIGFKSGISPSENLVNRLSAWAVDTTLRKNIGTGKWHVFTLNDFQNNADSLGRILSALRSDTAVAYANPFLVYKDGTFEGLTDRILVRTKLTADPQKIASLYASLGVYSITDDPFMARSYRLLVRPTGQMDALDLADSLYNSGLFDFSEPDFVVLNAFKTNDPLFNNQWYLRDTGQYGGTTGADIKAPGAWCSGTGTGIKIAIIDEGTDLTHPDLLANLLPGYDALDGGSNGGPSNDDAHGTATAGIAAAVTNNNLGVAGIAYNAKIIPIRAGTELGFLYSAAADGINWAISAAGGNADVINCSFGGGATSSVFNTAVANAISGGRGGKGCIMVFASGNDGGSSLVYPANLPNVLAVGGSNMCDQRVVVTPTTPVGSCNYDTRLATYSVNGASDYGTGLGVVAPAINITTTDIHGKPGFSNLPTQGWKTTTDSNYVYNFDGTSAAAPQASGVIALILSINTNLTFVQAIAILESTADKVGGYSYTTHLANGTWNTEMGYGRINATNAAAKAVSGGGMTGPSYICSGSSVYSVTVPTGATTTWSLSNGNGTLSCTICSSTSLTAVTAGQVTLTATFSNACGALPQATLTKSIYIKENPINVTSSPGGCSGGTQDWLLAATPATGSGWTWTQTGGTGLYFNSPNSSTTYVDVPSGGGGGVTLTYYDVCGVLQHNGTTVYNECGGEGEVAMTPNPATSSVTITPSNGYYSVLESTTFSLAEDHQSVTINADSIHSKQPNFRLYQFSSVKMVRFLDVTGRVRKTVPFEPNTKQVNINIGDLSSGMYFVEIFDDHNQHVTKKLMVQR